MKTKHGNEKLTIFGEYRYIRQKRISCINERTCLSFIPFMYTNVYQLYPLFVRTQLMGMVLNVFLQIILYSSLWLRKINDLLTTDKSHIHLICDMILQKIKRMHRIITSFGITLLNVEWLLTNPSLHNSARAVSAGIYYQQMHSSLHHMFETLGADCRNTVQPLFIVING